MPTEHQLTLSGLRQDDWVNPFGATPEELLAGALDEFGLMDKNTTINGKSARQYFETFANKRSRFQEATRIGSILLKQGVVTQEQLNDALKAQQGDGRPLGELLLALGICSPADIDRALTRQAEIREEFQRLEIAERERKGLWRRVVGFLTDDGRKRLSE